MKLVVVIQLLPPSVENSITPPSKAVVAFSKMARCQKERTAPVALAGMLIGLLSVRSWSETPAWSGAKTDLAPLCVSVVTTVQPQPPGTQVGTLLVKLPRPLSKPSVSRLDTPQGVDVIVGV